MSNDQLGNFVLGRPVASRTTKFDEKNFSLESGSLQKLLPV